jgi:hypothetical protein
MSYYTYGARNGVDYRARRNDVEYWSSGYRRRARFAADCRRRQQQRDRAHQQRNRQWEQERQQRTAARKAQGLPPHPVLAALLGLLIHLTGQRHQ